MSDFVALLKRRIVPAVFLGVLLALGARTCSSEAASSEIVVRVGEAGPSVRGVEAELWRGEEPPEVVGAFGRAHPRGSPPEAGRWEVRADPGLYRLIVDVKLEEKLRRFERSVEVRDGAVIRVNLEQELRDGAR